MKRGKAKQNRQVMSPEYIAEMVLYAAGFTGSNILGKKIMEPSFGAGRFLISILKRMIRGGNLQKLPKENIRKIFIENVSGIELFRSVILSDDFKRYCRLYGKNMSGGYPSVSAKLASQYPVRNGEI